MLPRLKNHRTNAKEVLQMDGNRAEDKFGKSLGAGSFGVVFEANYHGPVAVKVFRVDSFCNIPDVVQKFR